MASARPVVSVLDSTDGTTVKSSVKLPEVFTAPIRLDVVQHVQRDMAKNKRQAYAVSLEAGTYFFYWISHSHLLNKIDIHQMHKYSSSLSLVPHSLNSSCFSCLRNARKITLQYFAYLFNNSSRSYGDRTILGNGKSCKSCPASGRWWNPQIRTSCVSLCLISHSFHSLLHFTGSRKKLRKKKGPDITLFTLLERSLFSLYSNATKKI